MRLIEILKQIAMTFRSWKINPKQNWALAPTEIVNVAKANRMSFNSLQDVIVVAIGKNSSVKIYK